MSEIIKIALLGIAGVLFFLPYNLGQQRPEYTLLIGFALSVFGIFLCAGADGTVLRRSLRDYSSTWDAKRGISVF